MKRPSLADFAHLTATVTAGASLRERMDAPTARRSKFGNRKITLADGQTFDSLAEHRRYVELKLLEKAREIKELRRQVEYLLVPSQKKPGGGVERSVCYFADFVYSDPKRGTVVEDVKGFRTPDYILKRKLMLMVHGVEIKEVKP